MSASSLLSGTPAALSVNVDVQTLNANSAVIAGNASVGGDCTVDGILETASYLQLTNTAGTVGATLTGAQNGGGNVPRGVLTLVSNNAGVVSDSFFIAGSVANGLTIARDPLVGANAPVLTVDATNVTTIGDGVSATPLKVSGSDGIGIVYDTVNNPPFVEFYQAPTAEFPFTMPSSGDPNYTLLNITVPASAQNADYYLVDFLFNGTQTIAGGNPHNWKIYLTQVENAAFNPATSGALDIAISANTTWTGASYAGQSANPATISGGRLQLWYKPAVAGAITNLYLTVDATSVTTAGGTLNAGFALDALVTPFNLD